MSPHDYRRNAAECLTLAESAADPRIQAELLAMALSWLHLTDQAEKNLITTLVYETPPRSEG